MKKKILLVCLIAAAVIVVIVAVALALQSSSGNSYTSLLSEGEKYLSVGNYSNAIVVLEKAIEKEPDEPDAYIVLARAYLNLGNSNLALNTLENGYARTNNRTILRLLEEIDVGSVELHEPDVEQPTQATGSESQNNKSFGAALNTDFLDFVASASYEDYCLKYDNVTCSIENGVCVVRASGVDAALRFFDTVSVRVIDSSSGKPYGEFRPNEIVLDDITFLFGGGSQISLSELRSLQGISDLQQNGNELTFIAGGCKITITCSEDGTVYAGAANLIVPQGSNKKSDSYVVTGKVLDAATGSYISDASLSFYEGYSVYGDPVTAKTDSFGAYSVTLSSNGNYCVVIEKRDYITEETTIYVSSGSSETRQDFTISAKLQQGQIRFVLVWGASPTDLDSYLTGTTGSGKRIDVNYTHMTETDSNGNVLASLDVDDVSGYGPETITLNVMDGNFEYYVQDFTRSGTMSSSGAQVKIYMGDQLVQVVDVCGGLSNSWSVCKVVNGEIIITNGTR